MLRERRSSLHSRSRLSESAARRQTFAAAMQQFEEQFTAAQVVTSYTRPLNLYYGLAQAGMAIAAARSPDPCSFSRHGLSLVERSGDLATMTVRLEGEGGFQKIAAVIESPGISGAVALGALWASLPGLQAGKLPGVPWARIRHTERAARPEQRSAWMPTCRRIRPPGRHDSGNSWLRTRLRQAG